jgi:hypothetical protein
MLRSQRGDLEAGSVIEDLDPHNNLDATSLIAAAFRLTPSGRALSVSPGASASGEVSPHAAGRE